METPTPTPKKAAQVGYHIALIAGVVAALANPGTEINVPSNPEVVRRLEVIESKLEDPRVGEQADALRQEVAALRATLDLLIRYDGRLLAVPPLRVPILGGTDSRGGK